MDKKLDEMTNEEFGRLFPIIISEPDPNWIDLFKFEANNIKKVLRKRNILRIEHIGSTAVPNLKAKPSIDILLEVPGSIDKDEVIEKLTSLDYHYIPKPENPAPHMMFVKGYTLNGFRGQAYHIHVRYSGDWDELYFRDYLKLHPEIASEYGELKARLSVKYRNDREGYTEKKTDFIKRITGVARKEFIKEIEEPLVNKKYLLEKIPGKGGWTYAAIPKVLQNKKTPFGWVKVKGTIDDHEIKNYRLMPMGNGRLFLPVRAEIRKKIGKKEGDYVHVILYPDNSPTEIPNELLLCLMDDPNAYETFLGYSDGEQKAFIDWIYSAKTEDTRVERIARTLHMLSKRQKFSDKPS